MIQDLHHIAIAVSSIDEALPRWVDGFGLVLRGIEDVPTEKVKVAVLMAGATRIELVEPLTPDSPVARFLDKRGPGVHHLAFRVNSTGETIRLLMDRGVPMIDEAPTPGAHGCKIAFVHPKYLGGVLAELVEEPR